MRGAPTGAVPVYRRERWTTPDGDFVDVDFLDAARRAGPQPLLVLFHGLEGSSRSHYAEAFAAFAAARGMAFAVPHFRGCSGELNLAPRAYHSGDFEEIGWILARLRARRDAAGGGPCWRPASRWAAMRCCAGPRRPAARPAAAWPRGGLGVARRSTWRPAARPSAGASTGWSTRACSCTTMKPKALAKLAQHPGLFDREALLAARDLYAFDNVFTAPLHGFRGHRRLLVARLGQAAPGTDPRSRRWW